MLRTSLPPVLFAAGVLGGCSKAKGPDVCEVLTVVEPVTTSPLPELGRDIHVSPLANEAADYFASFVRGDEVFGEVLKGGRMLDPFETWPPEIVDVGDRFVGAAFHLHVRETGTAAGPSAEPPLLVDGHTLARPGDPPLPLAVPGSDDFAVLVSTIGTRSLVGSVHRVSGDYPDGLFSYGITLLDGNAKLAQPHPPACIKSSPHLTGTQLATSATRPGFLVGMAGNAEPSETCGDARPGFVVLERFLTPATPATQLELESVARIDAGGEVTFFRLVAAKDRIWLVFASSSDRATQTLQAMPLDADGDPVGPVIPLDGPVSGGPPFDGAPLQPRLFETSVVGDDLAVAWEDHDAAGHPIHVQLVHRDGALGPHTSFKTPDTQARFADVQITSDPDRRGVIVAWEKDDLGKRHAGMARVDCLAD